MYSYSYFSQPSFVVSWDGRNMIGERQRELYLLRKYESKRKIRGREKEDTQEEGMNWRLDKEKSNIMLYDVTTLKDHSTI